MLRLRLFPVLPNCPALSRNITKGGQSGARRFCLPFAWPTGRSISWDDVLRQKPPRDAFNQLRARCHPPWYRKIGEDFSTHSSAHVLRKSSRQVAGSVIHVVQVHSKLPSHHGNVALGDRSSHPGRRNFTWSRFSSAALYGELTPRGPHAKG